MSSILTARNPTQLALAPARPYVYRAAELGDPTETPLRRRSDANRRPGQRSQSASPSSPAPFATITFRLFR